MQSGRDSSIWRSLAVAFGDGVAFGVGVKLAQRPNRPTPGAPSAEVSPAANRLEQIEERMAAIEHAPAPAIPPVPGPFDQKVLEAVVNALDARLHEQSGQVERRLTELQAKLAIELKSLERQDYSIAAGFESRLAQVHGQYNEHVAVIRNAVAQDMDLLYSQLAQLRQEYDAGAGTAIEEKIAAAVTSRLESRLESLGSRLHGEVVGAVDRAGEQLISVHAALAQKDREIAELRQRVADNEQTVLDLILAMGQMCRQVADRISSPASLPTAVSYTHLDVYKRQGVTRHDR